MTYDQLKSLGIKRESSSYNHFKMDTRMYVYLNDGRIFGGWVDYFRLNNHSHERGKP